MATLQEHRLEEVASGFDCPVQRAVAVVGSKWTLLIIHELMDGPRRFGELRRALEDASPKMLTARLREMEELGLVTRTVYPEVPLHVEYRLTDTGHSLKPIIDDMAKWGGSLAKRKRAAKPR